MSRPRLHDSLSALFDEKSADNLTRLIRHPALAHFERREGLDGIGDELVQAFIHKSFAHEYGLAHQEKLEFLGDAVLQLILTEVLFEKFPEDAEGVLSKKRSALVNEGSLAKLARGLGLPELVIVGKGEFKKKLFEQDVVLADTVEALLAVIYRKMGFDFTRKLLLRWIDLYLPGAYDVDPGSLDWKSRLQEATLAKFKSLPKYTSSEAGQEFLVELWVEGKKLAEGVFPNKKSGEKSLAEAALKKNLI